MEFFHFHNCLKILSYFSGKSGQNLGKFGKNTFIGGSLEEYPEDSEFIKILVEKSLEPAIFDNYDVKFAIFIIF